MKPDSPIVNARSSIVWIAAILLSFGAVGWIEKESGRELIAHTQASQPRASASLQYTSDKLQLPAPRALDATEQEWARIAWVYFQRNTDAQTGLANSVDGFPSASLWDEGSYLMALLAAQRMGIVTQQEFDARTAKALDSLARIPLTDANLPNKAYDVHTLAMTDYRDQPAPRGIGVSAIDVARLVAPLQAIVWRHPRHTEAVRKVLARWNVAALAANGQLYGLAAIEGRWQPVQEGRVGYEQYAAEALAPWHLDDGEAAQWTAHARWIKVGDVQVPADDRRGAAVDAVVSEPYVLDGLEFGWSRTAREFAWRVYSAQEARFRSTGIATAASEDHLDRAPFFAYSAVVAHEHPWTALSSEGEEIPAAHALSLKAAFGWHALLRTPYTAQLVEKMKGLHEAGKGWYAGIYEADGQPNHSINCNTNAVVLESLAYIAGGPLGGPK